jgi:hypothetical protein
LFSVIGSSGLLESVSNTVLLWGWADTKVLSLPLHAAVRVWKGGEKVFEW